MWEGGRRAEGEGRGKPIRRCLAGLSEIEEGGRGQGWETPWVRAGGLIVMGRRGHRGRETRGREPGSGWMSSETLVERLPLRTEPGARTAASEKSKSGVVLCFVLRGIACRW